MSGFVRTILGDVPPGELGLTLPHEHLLVHLEGWTVPVRSPEEEEFARAPLSLSLLHRVHRRALSNRDNCRIDDIAGLETEVSHFLAAGGGALADLTLADIGRDQTAQEQIAQSTGVHVIAGCGYYVHDAHPPELETMSAEAIADTLIRELLEAQTPRGWRAGVIGEIGTSKPITERERKVLRAAVRAHTATGAPLSIHLFPGGGSAEEVLDLLEGLGANPNKVALCHLDGQTPIPIEEHLRLAARGAFVEYDCFGANWASDDMRELYQPVGYWSPPASDQERVRAAAVLFERGYGHRVLISHDVCTKIQQRAWGGTGYAHIPEYIQPFLRANGFSQAEVDQLLCANPQEWLTWV